MHHDARSPSVAAFASRAEPPIRSVLLRYSARGTWGVELIVDVPRSDGAERWCIRGRPPFVLEMSEGLHTGLTYVEDHIVLRALTEPRARLVSDGRFRMPHAVMGALYAAHHAWSDGWIPLERYLREPTSLFERLDGGDSSRLAIGPRSLIEALAEALVPFELRPRVERTAVPAKRDLVALLFGRRSYLAAAHLSAEPISFDTPIAGRSLHRVFE